MKNILKYTLIIIALPFCVSCKAIYGIKSFEKKDIQEILVICEKLGIPTQDSYYLNSESYLKHLFKESKEITYEVKNHMQPLQILYYEPSGKLVSFHANCYATGFPNLNWNHQNQFNVFPPVTVAPINDLINLEEQANFLRSFNSENISFNTVYDYYVFVYWHTAMNRQAKRLVELVKKNTQKTNKKVKVYYVNIDDLFNKTTVNLN